MMFMDIFGSNKKRCFICNGVISGSYYEDHLGKFACVEHEVKICLSCRGLCDPKKSYNIRGYGHICADCAQKCISGEDAAKLARYVQKYYHLAGFSLPGHKLHLVTITDLRESSPDSVPVGLAYDHGGGIYKIKVLKHLSKVAFASVFAHEILHLWQYSERIEPPIEICEGFCELGAYQVLDSIDKEEAKKRMVDLMENPDSIYGEGFRKLKPLYDLQGWEGMRKYMRKFSRR